MQRAPPPALLDVPLGRYQGERLRTCQIVKEIHKLHREGSDVGASLASASVMPPSAFPDPL